MNIPKYIERPVYMDRIMPYARKDIMKILVGQRRVGKSYLLFQLSLSARSCQTFGTFH